MGSELSCHRQGDENLFDGHSVLVGTSLWDMDIADVQPVRCCSITEGPESG